MPSRGRGRFLGSNETVKLVFDWSGTSGFFLKHPFGEKCDMSRKLFTFKTPNYTFQNMSTEWPTAYWNITIFPSFTLAVRVTPWFVRTIRVPAIVWGVLQLRICFHRRFFFCRRPRFALYSVFRDAHVAVIVFSFRCRVVAIHGWNTDEQILLV